DLQADASIDWFTDGTGTPQIINQGMLKKSGGTNVSSINAPLFNTGTVDCQAAKLTIFGGGNGNGIFHTAAGATLSFLADYEVDGPLTGAGTNSFDGGSFILNGTMGTSNAVLTGSVLGGTTCVVAD